MSKPLSHELDVYGFWIHLATDRRAWTQLRRTIKSLEQKPPEAAGSVTFVQHESPPPKPFRYTRHYVVWVDLAISNGGRDLVDTVAHEAAHVAHDWLEHLEHKSGDDEPAAYLVGWVAGWIWNGCHPDA